MGRIDSNAHPPFQGGHETYYEGNQQEGQWPRRSGTNNNGPPPFQGGHETYYGTKQQEGQLALTVVETEQHVVEREETRRPNPPPRASYVPAPQPQVAEHVQIPRPNPLPRPNFPAPQPQVAEHWKSGLFDCMNDPTNALVTFCFPCITFGQIAEIVDSASPSCEISGLFYTLLSLVWLPCILSCTYRTKLRRKFNLIEGGPDCLTHFFCDYCALCQEYRELQSRGWDPTIGYRANVHQQRQVAMKPPPNQHMMG